MNALDILSWIGIGALASGGIILGTSDHLYRNHVIRLAERPERMLSYPEFRRELHGDIYEGKQSPILELELGKPSKLLVHPKLVLNNAVTYGAYLIYLGYGGSRKSI